MLELDSDDDLRDGMVMAAPPWDEVFGVIGSEI
jgi:hypothetical protein